MNARQMRRPWTAAVIGVWLLTVSAHAQNPGTNLNAPATFGKIRSARDMRRIQLGVRVSF